jgi:hypothetical protein
MAISKLWLNGFEEMVGLGGGSITLDSLSTIKKGNFNFQTRWPFFEIFTTTLYKPYMPPWHNSQPLQWGLWGGGAIILKYLISRTFDYIEQKDISKFWLDVFGEMVGVRRRLVALQSVSTIEKALVLSIFNWICPFWRFYNIAFYKNLTCSQFITYAWKIIYIYYCAFLV